MTLRVLLRNFSTGVYIGVFNTLIHWSVFLTLHGVMSVRQSIRNVCAFVVPATFSFHTMSLVVFSAVAGVADVHGALCVFFAHGATSCSGATAE